MPVPVAAKAGIIVATVAVAAAIALYESPEVRRVADDLRRRIAIALHSLGDNLDPTRERDPVFNRPEDAEGFLQSRGGNDTGVDADDETRRRQREELMYWNAVREERERQLKKEAEEAQQGAAPSGHRRVSSRGSTFDDFLQEDKTAEQRGTLVYNTGARVWDDDQPNVLRRRGPVEGVRGLNASMIANPFADEYGIELDDHPGMPKEAHPLSVCHDEVMSDIYDATPKDGRSMATSVSHTLSPQTKPEVPEVLFDFDSHSRSDSATVDHEPQTTPAQQQQSQQPISLYEELKADEYMTAGQEDRNNEDVFASIQAWAQNSNTSFYSPLPESPAAPLSEPSLLGDEEGERTPTDSMSIAGSGVDVENDGASSKGGDFDIISEDGDGIATPSSWSEVGSVISEADGVAHA